MSTEEKLIADLLWGPNADALFIRRIRNEAASAIERLSAIEQQRDEFRQLYLDLMGPTPVDDSTAEIVKAVEYWVNSRFGGDATVEQITALVVEAMKRAALNQSRTDA
jgi:hypothetical protein